LRVEGAKKIYIDNSDPNGLTCPRSITLGRDKEPLAPEILAITLEHTILNVK